MEMPNKITRHVLASRSTPSFDFVYSMFHVYKWFRSYTQFGESLRFNTHRCGMGTAFQSHCAFLRFSPGQWATLRGFHHHTSNSSSPEHQRNTPKGCLTLISHKALFPFFQTDQPPKKHSLNHPKSQVYGFVSQFSWIF